MANPIAQDIVTVSTLLNTAHLISEVVRNIAGEEISNSLDGQNIEGSILADTIAVKLQAELAQHLPRQGE